MLSLGSTKEGNHDQHDQHIGYVQHQQHNADCFKPCAVGYVGWIQEVEAASRSGLHQEQPQNLWQKECA